MKALQRSKIGSQPQICNVLLTGATGFVGRHVLSALKGAGYRVRVIKRTDGSLLSADETIHTSDLFSETPAFWKTALKDIDAVIHCAWYAEPGKYLQSPLNLSCLQGTLTLGEAVKASKVQTFIGIGTCFEYDLSTGILPTTTKLNPLTPYAGMKAAAFLALSQIFAASQKRFAWCRLFYLYGEGEDSRRLAPHIHEKLSLGEPAELTSGRQIRDFMDVAQAGQKIVDILATDCSGPLNICSGVPITVRQLAEQIADVYERRDLLHFGVRADNIVDPPCVVGVPTILGDGDSECG